MLYFNTLEYFLKTWENFNNSIMPEIAAIVSSTTKSSIEILCLFFHLKKTTTVNKASIHSYVTKKEKRTLIMYYVYFYNIVLLES